MTPRSVSQSAWVKLIDETLADLEITQPDHRGPGLTGGVEIRLLDGIDCRATSRLAPACKQGFTLYASAASNIWRMYVKIIMTIAAAAAAVRRRTPSLTKPCGSALGGGWEIRPHLPRRRRPARLAHST